MINTYQSIKHQTQSDLQTNHSYLNFNQDYQFKKNTKTLAFIKTKSNRNRYSNLIQINLSHFKNLFINSTLNHHKRTSTNLIQLDYNHSRSSIETNPTHEDQSKNSSLQIDFSNQDDILIRSERVQSAFIEHCQWTNQSSSSIKLKNLLNKLTEENLQKDFKDDEIFNKTSIDKITPNKPNSEINLNHSKSIKYLSVNSFDTLVSNSNQSTSIKLNQQQPLLNPPMKFNQYEKSSFQLNHEFNTINEFDEFDDHHLDPNLNLNHASASSSNSNQTRKISFLDWILCSCCISNQDLNHQFDLQIHKTCPE